MPRQPRIILPGQPIHVVQRGNNRQPVFHDGTDHVGFLELLQKASHETACAIHAYVLMTNHFHLLLTPEDERAPARLLQKLTGWYARYFNLRYQRSGGLWEGRYRSFAIDSVRYLLRCSRYIERNPVRAGIVSSPGEYPWSSYRSNADGESSRIVTPHQEQVSLALPGMNWHAAYKALFATHVDSEAVEHVRRGTMAWGRDATTGQLGANSSGNDSGSDSRV